MNNNKRCYQYFEISHFSHRYICCQFLVPDEMNRYRKAKPASNSHQQFVMCRMLLLKSFHCYVMYDAGVREVRTLKFRLYGVGGSATAISAQKVQVRNLAKL